MLSIVDNNLLSQRSMKDDKSSSFRHHTDITWLDPNSTYFWFGVGALFLLLLLAVSAIVWFYLTPKKERWNFCRSGPVVLAGRVTPPDFPLGLDCRVFDLDARTQLARSSGSPQQSTDPFSPGTPVARGGAYGSSAPLDSESKRDSGGFSYCGLMLVFIVAFATGVGLCFIWPAVADQLGEDDPATAPLELRADSKPKGITCGASANGGILVNLLSGSGAPFQRVYSTAELPLTLGSTRADDGGGGTAASCSWIYTLRCSENIELSLRNLAHQIMPSKDGEAGAKLERPVLNVTKICNGEVDPGATKEYRIGEPAQPPVFIPIGAIFVPGTVDEETANEAASPDPNLSSGKGDDSVVAENVEGYLFFSQVSAAIIEALLKKASNGQTTNTNIITTNINHHHYHSPNGNDGGGKGNDQTIESLMSRLEDCSGKLALCEGGNAVVPTTAGLVVPTPAANDTALQDCREQLAAANDRPETEKAQVFVPTPNTNDTSLKNCIAENTAASISLDAERTKVEACNGKLGDCNGKLGDCLDSLVLGGNVTPNKNSTANSTALEDCMGRITAASIKLETERERVKACNAKLGDCVTPDENSAANSTALENCLGRITAASIELEAKQAQLEECRGHLATANAKGDTADIETCRDQLLSSEKEVENCKDELAKEQKKNKKTENKSDPLVLPNLIGLGQTTSGEAGDECDSDGGEQPVVVVNPHNGLPSDENLTALQATVASLKSENEICHNEKKQEHEGKLHCEEELKLARKKKDPAPDADPFLDLPNLIGRGD